MPASPNIRISGLSKTREASFAPASAYVSTAVTPCGVITAALTLSQVASFAKLEIPVAIQFTLQVKVRGARSP